MKYAVRDLLLVKTKEALDKYMARTKMNPLKRPVVVDEGDILEEATTDRLEGVYSLGDASSIMFGLRRGQGMNAVMVKAAADDGQKTQWTTEVLSLLVMGNP